VQLPTGSGARDSRLFRRLTFEKIVIALAHFPEDARKQFLWSGLSEKAFKYRLHRLGRLLDQYEIDLKDLCPALDVWEYTAEFRLLRILCYVCIFHETNLKEVRQWIAVLNDLWRQRMLFLKELGLRGKEITRMMKEQGKISEAEQFLLQSLTQK